jgi:Cytochrome c7 and related cytochrome c
MLFPKWANKTPLPLTVAGLVAGVGLITAIAFILSPYTTQVGYSPTQPVPYSHKLHAGDLGMDCRYCHVAVERSPVAMVPVSTTCMNCHRQIKPDSPKLAPVRESVQTGMPVEWIRIYHSPDFVYFNHSVHVNAGVGCESCHGRIDQMEVVHQAKPLNMAWCLDCHRNPEKYLRPVEAVTTMGYVPAGNQLEIGAQLARAKNIHPPVDCGGCHR